MTSTPPSPSGPPELPPSPEVLRAGPLQALHEPASGFLRRIRLGGREVLRGIYAAVRDSNWDTIPGTRVETRREVLADSFHLEFECRHRRGEIDFAWHGTLTGTAEGVIRYTFEGEARSTFRRNRIGFCVLHPIRECAGGAARQTRVEGPPVEGRFPETIEPQIFGQSSFKDLRKVAHELEPGVWAEVEFEGEVFEMEDQRNWTDASFKTYCTPLALPFPVVVPAGTRLRQEITLRLLGWCGVRSPGPVIETSPDPAAPIVLEPGPATPARLPALGLGLASHENPLTPTEIQRLRALRLAHLRVDLHLGSPDWPNRWDRARRESGDLGVRLELALHLPRDGSSDAPELRRRLEGGRHLLARVLALREGEAATSRETLAAMRLALRGWEIPVGAGSDANFCELNRDQALGRCAPGDADFVFWSINPQVHARDDLSLMENLEAQSATVRTARTFARGRPLVVSPVTLRQRFNPVATGPESDPPPGELPRPVDPRQAGALGAAWTLGSLAELASAGVEAITCYETTGWRGVMERESGPPNAAEFPSVPGALFPLYHVFAAVAGFAGGEVLPVNPLAPGSVAALALQGSPGRALLVANLEPRPVTIDVAAFPDLAFLLTPAPAWGATFTGDPPGRSTNLLVLPAYGVVGLRSRPDA